MAIYLPVDAVHHSRCSWTSFPGRTSYWARTSDARSCCCCAASGSYWKNLKKIIVNNYLELFSLKWKKKKNVDKFKSYIATDFFSNILTDSLRKSAYKYSWFFFSLLGTYIEMFQIDVSKNRNHLMKISFLPKHQQNFVKDFWTGLWNEIKSKQ